MVRLKNCITQTAFLVTTMAFFLFPAIALGNEIPNTETIPAAIVEDQKKNQLFPIDVEETMEKEYGVIIRTYAVKPDENPNDIPTESFEKFGFTYELSEVVTIETSTNDMNEVLKQIAPEITYEKDGYTGILKLDLSTVVCEPAGYSTTGYTKSVKREYNGLASQDTSTIPKSVDDGGFTYAFDDIQFKPQYTNSIDYEEIAQSYTAVVTYTRSGTVKNVTGYITTATYTGTIARTLTNETIYKVYFISTDPIIEPEPEPEPIPEPIIEQEKIEPDKRDSSNMALTLSVVSLLICLGIVGYLVYKNIFNTTIYYKQGIEYKKVAQMKINYKADPPTINISKVAEKTSSNDFVIELSKSAMKTVLKQGRSENVIRVILRDMERIHTITPYAVAEKYQFEVSFNEEKGDDYYEEE